MNDNVLVYGAYGHTGRFVVAELLRLGLTPILSGRDPSRLAALAGEFPGLDVRAATASDVSSATDGAAVVVNCAGPFLDTAIPVAHAAVRAGAHYLDVSAEQPSVREVYRAAASWSTDVAVVPAMAFYGGLADLMATAVVRDWENASGSQAGGHEITVVFGVDRWWPTEGTRETGRRNTAPRQVVEGGRLVPASSRSFPVRAWPFSGGLGHQAVTGMPFSEVIAMARHLGASRISTYLTTGALDDIADPSTAGPEAADESGRSAQRFEVDVVVRRGPAAERRMSVSGRDIYAFSGTLVAEAALWLVDGRAKGGGVAAPGEVFDAAEFLRNMGIHLNTQANITYH